MSSLDRRKKASDILKAIASKTQNPEMTALAISARLDSFVRVKKAIDDMVAQLLQEKAAEIEKRDFCINGLNENVRTTEEKVHTKSTIESKISSIELDIKELEDAIATLQSEIAQLNTELAQAKADRDLEHQYFEATIADQRATRELLTQALDALKEAYKSPSDYAFAQKGKKQTPPAEFSTYEKHRGGVGVVGMIEQIITDTENMEKAAQADEFEAVQAFLAYQQETVTSIKAKEEGITNKTKEKAAAEMELTTAKTELTGVNGELQSLSEDKAGLHSSCDFLLKNFEARQQGRDDEVEALRQAKAYLSGMQ